MDGKKQSLDILSVWIVNESIFETVQVLTLKREFLIYEFAHQIRFSSERIIDLSTLN